MNKFIRIFRYELPMHFILWLTNGLPDNVIFIRLRGSLIRPFFKSCGKNLGVARNVTFYNSYKMNIGNNVYVAYGCWFGGSIEIEDEVLFGPYCILSPSNHTKIDDSFRFGNNTDGRILIKRGSWLGAQSQVIGNTVLGAGSVLAANSVLIKDSNDNSLYAGNPAKYIKTV